ncbi:hypothetical protein TBLA_0A03870 [Henningerozyma blattae CBS 6284]|uniref:Uncharacterized protein n=1 Tax=Henningerozyma blattae (strain ATCC 34711 / CBS 6284 / DSM 70876 / NBRC 10599 / NRRL Y-10934 / UCD 77-7) TaxID=1071380 RepID=I2GVN3_HENB6|nr:hypothetical protein TBLA_0A03870 [Tetrapisispora blattae CBS 6284]CCH58185.1 hypothetical protein TBLA_0A03870 [Tetrapisispora blattae CBS 6284]
MSLPLKSLTIDSNSKQLDSKQKKFHSNVQRALEHFDSVTEWADYIASLGKLLKALQSWKPQFNNVKYYVPSPYQVSRRLTSSLSPNLPAGVHQKTLEVYTFIFTKIGQDTLAKECNIWVPGILPLMSYASMSVKSHLIELYDSHLVQLPKETLTLLIRPLLASLLPGIDDESSEFQPLTMNLIDLLKKINNDSLFWQTCFLIMIKNKGRRLGGLVWLTKRFPSLNAVPHLLAELKKKNNEGVPEDISKEEKTFSVLLPESKDLVTPDTTLLIRCLVSSLTEGNDLLIKRGVLDLLLQRLHLDSPILQNISTREDVKLLIMTTLKTTLSKDMSLNRRVWNWLLGSSTSTGRSFSEKERNKTSEDIESNEGTSDFFSMFGLSIVIEGLKELVNSEETVNIAFNICLAVMDRWEIGSAIIPEMFIPLLLGSQRFSENQQILKVAGTFFDAVETNIIWGKVFQWFMSTKDFEFLNFILTRFNISTDEEIIVRHLPMILLALLSISNISDTTIEFKKGASNRYSICQQLLDSIPERAYLPLTHSTLKFSDKTTNNNTLEKIMDYYISVSDPSKIQESEKLIELSLPFSTENLSFLTVKAIHTIVLENLKNSSRVYESCNIFIRILDKIPTMENNKKEIAEDWSTDQLLNGVSEALTSATIEGQAVFGILSLYSNYLAHRIDLISSTKLLRSITVALWPYIVGPHKQLKAVKGMQALIRNIPIVYVEAALAHAFVQESDISKQLKAIELLWSHFDNDSGILAKPLQLILDELFDQNNPHYLYVSKWLLNLKQSKTINRLFDLLVNQLIKFDFWTRDSLVGEDDMDEFTYRIQSLLNVLVTNEGQIIEVFSTELSISPTLSIWNKEDTSTFKNHTLLIILKFLEMKNNNNARSIRSVLLLLDHLLNGTEMNFRVIVISLLQMSSNYVSLGDIDSESMAVSLINIVSKVLRLSHVKGIKLDIFNDNTTHLKYIDYLVTSSATMDTPLILASYVKLLSESVVYFEESIFRMILPLTASMVNCLQKLFEAEKVSGGNYQSIILLFNGLEELLDVAHARLLADQRDGYLATSGSRGSDFLQSVVSNVFSTDNSQLLTKIQGERDVVIQSFKQVIDSCIDVWCWIHSTFGNDSRAVSETESHTSYKLKFRTKSLLEKLFLAEPLEVLEGIIHGHQNETAVVLIRALDGNRPKLTVPYFLYSIVVRYNKSSTIKFNNFTTSAMSGNRNTRFEPTLLNKISGQKILVFLFDYIDTLENASVEDFYNEFIIFIKEVINNYSNYNPVATKILKLFALVSEKVYKTSFAEQKTVNREISENFLKYLPTALSDLQDKTIPQAEKYDDLIYLLSQAQYVSNDSVGSDKYNGILSSIVSQCIIPFIRGKNEEVIPTHVLHMCIELSKTAERVKIWKSLINELFEDDKKFFTLAKLEEWRILFADWCQYPDNKSRILNDLLLLIDSKNNSVTPVLLNFNSWNVSELENKCKNITRIAYLVTICPDDFFILQFQSLINYTCQYLVSKEVVLRSKCWILLRALLLKFSISHFNDYWSSIVYCLQTNLQEFYEALQLQGSIDHTSVFQTCKSLDLILAMNVEDFDATNEWLFIIDTINCLTKTEPYMALSDEICETKPFKGFKPTDNSLHLNEYLPLLSNIHSIKTYSELGSFFKNITINSYNTMFQLKSLDLSKCKTDLLDDMLQE